MTTSAGDRDRPAVNAAAFFDELWADGDPWKLESSALDQARYRRQIELLEDRRYPRALEIGCAAGSFTRHLHPLCGNLLAVDIAQPAVDAARAAAIGAGTVTFRHADVMAMDVTADGPWDLVVLSETAYYLGWSHSLYDVGWLAHSLWQATSPDGRLLLVNSFGDRESSLMSPWLIRTYRDLFLNVGYGLEREEVLGGEKEGVHFDILLSLLRKSP